MSCPFFTHESVLEVFADRIKQEAYQRADITPLHMRDAPGMIRLSEAERKKLFMATVEIIDEIIEKETS